MSARRGARGADGAVATAADAGTVAPGAATTRWVEMDLAELAPDEANPREMDNAALDGLDASLGEFGLVENLVWNERTGELVGGHQRRRALLRRGETRAMVCVGDWTVEQQRRLNVALNNPALQGRFSGELAQYLESALAELPAPKFRALRFDALFPEPKKPRGKKAGAGEGRDLKYQLVVACSDEQQQAELLDELLARGLEVKPMIL